MTIYLQADAYNGYDGIYLGSGGKIIEVGCWQHARKRFKAAEASDLRAQVALPKSELGEAIRYTLNHWDALQVFTTCGLLDPDNNEAERGHRGVAIGRKNWRMVGSDRGGEAAAIHFSFIASCKMNNVESFTYGSSEKFCNTTSEVDAAH
jgi:hypothetical protein